MNIITHARLITMDADGVIEDGFLAWEGDRISALGPMSNLPPEVNLSSGTRIDAQGRRILPGFIDAHSHIGLFDDSLDFEGDDGNEETDPVTPQLRALDGIHNGDVCFREAYEGGVAIVMTGPGSGNVLGGQFALIRTYERTVDRAVLVAPSAQKAALGENPKRVYGKDNKAPATRMGTAGILRDTLFKASDYRDKLREYEERKEEYDEARAKGEEDLPDAPDKPEFDFISESLIPVLEAKIPLKIHAHRQDDILTAIRICNEFGLIYTLEHCTEGHLIADILGDEYREGLGQGRGTAGREGSGGRLLGVIVGPVLGDRSKPELSNMTIRNAAVLKEEGLPVAIMTDHPCVPEQYLALSAAIAVRGGMKEEDALAAITKEAARIAGIEDRFGSLAVGKHADFSLFSGDPLDPRSCVELFVGGGQIRYNPHGIPFSAPVTGG